MSSHSYGGSIEVPDPLIHVNTTERWRDAGWTGYREYTTTISMGDVVLLERTANDEDDFRVSEASLQEETVNEFGRRLKELLGL